MSLSTFVGSVGCFTRIQAFLETDVRVDKRTKALDYHNDGYSNSERSSTGQEVEATEIKETRIATKELSDFLSDTNAISIKDGSFGWDPTKSPILSGISIDIPFGQFTMFVGPVGCGKSTLLKSILGECSIMEGSIQVKTAEMAYCDQTPWHMNGTVRESIVAFSEEDERWYQLVIRACALEPDFQQLPRGDNTTIGSKGIALSGGQSQRIVRAR